MNRINEGMKLVRVFSQGCSRSAEHGAAVDRVAAFIGSAHACLMIELGFCCGAATELIVRTPQSLAFILFSLQSGQSNHQENSKNIAKRLLILVGGIIYNTI